MTVDEFRRAARFSASPRVLVDGLRARALCAHAHGGPARVLVIVDGSVAPVWLDLASVDPLVRVVA